MAPEQAAGLTKDIGPPADIFALGVVLYEMLTGRPPFQANTPMETIMRVLALDPVPPRKLQRRVPRDLETICLKCLQKQPAKRYATAQLLAEDCGAFLRGEPIQARPMPLWEQAVSWARRRPAWAALCGTSALAVLVVMVVVLLSNASLQEQRRIADEKRQEAETQRSRAVRHLRKACDAVDLMLSRVGFERLADVPAVAPVQRELLEDALHFYQELAQQEAADPELRHELGRAHRRLGKLYQSLGELEKAEQSFRAALAVHAPMVEEAPSVPEYRRELASSHNNLGLLLGGRNQPEKAEQELRQAIDLQEKLVADFPDEPNYLLELSQSYDTLGTLLDPLHKDQEAEQALRHSGELAEQLLAKHPGVPEYENHRANNNMNLGVYLARRKRLGEAEIAFRRDVELWSKLAETSPGAARLRARLALGCYNLGNLLAETKQPQEAEKFLRRSVELRKRLTEEFPAVPDYRAALADTLHKVAQLLRTSDVPAAAALWEQAVEQQQASLKVNPDSAEKRRALFLFRWNLADARVRLGQHSTAAQAAAGLLPISPGNYEDCYHATRLFARCAVLAEKDTTLSEEERKTLAQQYAGQAVEALREAVRRGYFDFRYIKDDHSLDVLRSRDDFQQLLAGLRNKPR
jgi:serine/threonine-protein kinase